jgi:hypothetical protein
MVKCLIDDTDHEDLEALHKYLRKLKIKQEEYYTKYLPRFDKWTGKQIPFTNLERYLNTEFLHKNNLKAFVKTGSEESKEWSINWLAKRKEEKGLTYPPLQAELRTLMAPTIPYYEYIGGYNEICKNLGYQIRFNGQPPKEINKLQSPIIVDTREQTPLKINHDTVSKSLVCGDYGLAESHDKGVYIERKSFTDFINTLSDRENKKGDSNFARFNREIERAGETGAYIIMLVEHSISECAAFDSIPFLRIQLGKLKVTPDHIFYNLRSLIKKYNNFQPLFVKNRTEAADAVVNLLAMGDAVKTFDIHLAYEQGKIIKTEE